jgi:hypothetical protein
MAPFQFFALQCCQLRIPSRRQFGCLDQHHL